MTTTCIPQSTTITRSEGRERRVSARRPLRAALAALLRRQRGRKGGGGGRRATRSTPSQTALDSIESFPGLHR